MPVVTYRRSMIRRKFIPLSLAAATAGALFTQHDSLQTAQAADEGNSKKEPLKVLMFAGGCCHDYENQKEIISAGIGERANVDWEIIHAGGKGHEHRYKKLLEKDWHVGYDAVVYNICFAREKDEKYIEAITETHKQGLGAVAIHCTAHSYHWKVETKAWPQFLGVTSMNHGKKHPITMRTTAAKHPVMQGFPYLWTTPKGELYNVKKVWPTATVLADGTIDGGTVRHPCVWVNDHGKGRVFSTTVGHHNETMMEPLYLDLVARGLLWVGGKLDDDGTPATGYGVE